MSKPTPRQESHRRYVKALNKKVEELNSARVAADRGSGYWSEREYIAANENEDAFFQRFEQEDEWEL